MTAPSAAWSGNLLFRAFLDLLFRAFLDAFTWIGGSLIVASVSYIAWREHPVRSAAAGRAEGRAHG